MEVSQSCFCGGPCKLAPLLSEARLRKALKAQQFSHHCQHRALPRDRAEAPLPMPLRALGETETLNLSAPAECLALWEPSN